MEKSNIKCIYCGEDTGNSPDKFCSDECEIDYNDVIEEYKLLKTLEQIQ